MTAPSLARALALVAAVAAGAAGCKAEQVVRVEPDGLVVQVVLAENFARSLITGLDVIVDSAPGGPPLGFAPAGETPVATQPVPITAQTRSVDADAEAEYVISLRGNPFTGNTYTLFLPFAGTESAPFSLRADVRSSRGVVATGAVTQLATGDSLALRLATQRTVVVNIACQPGVSCVGQQNRNPVLAQLAAAPLRLRAGRTLRLVVDAYDPDGDALTYEVDAAEIAALPDAPAFDAMTRSFAWTPSAPGGPYPLSFEVRDGRGGVDRQTVSLVVVNDNSAPVWRPVGTRFVPEGQVLSLPVEVSDPDGEPLTVTLDKRELPPVNDATFDSDRNLFTWTPTFRDGRSDRPYEVRLVARDPAGAESTLTIPVFVTDVNRAPLLAVPEELTVAAGTRVAVALSATDPDGDPLAVTLDGAGLPPGSDAALDGLDFSWTPAVTAVREGPWVARFIADDGKGGLHVRTLRLRVRAAGAGPQLVAVAPQSVTAGGTLRFAVTTRDSTARATITLDPASFPARNGATFDGHEVSWTPGAGLVRSTPYGAVFTATGDAGLTARLEVLITVEASVPAKLLFPAPPASVTAGATLAPAVRVTIADGAGNRVASAINEVTLALSPNAAGGALTGTLTARAQNGEASFGELRVERAAPGYRLVATSPGLTGTTSALFDVTPATTASLTVAAPATGVALAALSVTVTARDAFANTTPAYTGTVRVTSSDPLATLPPATTFTAADAGTRTFQVTFGTQGAQTLTFTDAAAGTILGTATVTVGHGPVTAFVLAGPSLLTAGHAAEVTVVAQDALGNTALGYRGAMTLTSDDPQVPLLASYAFTASDAGQHVFSVTLRTAGMRELAAADSAQPSARGTLLAEVRHDAATHLAFDVQPGGAKAGAVLAPALVVSVRDAHGNVVVDATGAVTLSLAVNPAPGDASLGGTRAKAPQNGLATFDDLTVSLGGAGYVLGASTPSLPAANSSAFTVRHAPRLRALCAEVVRGGIDVAIVGDDFDPVTASSNAVSFAPGVPATVVSATRRLLVARVPATAGAGALALAVGGEQSNTLPYAAGPMWLSRRLGGEGPRGFASRPSVSADGRFVAFASSETDLAAGDTNNATDVFVADRTTGVIERVSVASDGTQANGQSEAPAISADGRFVAFVSHASNLVAGGAFGAYDIFVRDRRLRTTERVSVASDGTPARMVNNFSSPLSYWPALSADGRFVVFTSDAINLVEGDTNGNGDVFLHDRATRVTRRINLGPDGQQTAGSVSYPTISQDGRVIAFTFSGGGLLPGLESGQENVYAHDRLAGTTSLVSRSLGGAVGNGHSTNPSLSADGRLVAYESQATNLVGGDSNGAKDVFVFDRVEGTTRRVSVGSGGAQANGASLGASISGDGRFVAFESAASNLVAGDTNGIADVFVHDLQTAQTQRVTLGASGAQVAPPSGSGESGQLVAQEPRLSADGRFVVFASNGEGLAPQVTGGFSAVFLTPVSRQQCPTPAIYAATTELVRAGATLELLGSGFGRVAADNGVSVGGAPALVAEASGARLSIQPGAALGTGDVEVSASDLVSAPFPLRAAPDLVSLTTEGNGLENHSMAPALSADGRFVAFTSTSLPLFPGGPVAANVFLRDRQAGTTVRISRSTTGGATEPPDAWSNQVAISADGQVLAFASGANNLVDGDTNGRTDVFVFDQRTGVTKRVSVATGGAQAVGGDSSAPSISADGRFVAFESTATNLVAGDTNNCGDVFVHDLRTQQTTRVSVTSSGAQAVPGFVSQGSRSPALSADGRFVAFESDAANLVAGDTNGVLDIFVHDRGSGTTTRVSVATGGVQGNGHSTRASLSGDGRFVAFDSGARSLAPGKTTLDSDVFLHDRTTGETTRITTGLAGEEADSSSLGARLSRDGRYLAFFSFATNLVPGDSNGVGDVFVHDRLHGTTSRVSLRLDGSQASRASGLYGGAPGTALSADGRYVAFASEAIDLVEGDENGAADIFITPTAP